MSHMRKLLALLLTAALLISLAPDVGINRAATASAEAAESDRSLYSLLTGAEANSMTWAQGAKTLAHMLGYIESDIADIDLSAYADEIPGISATDDSLYLAILAANGYLDGVEKPINPQDPLARDECDALVEKAFPKAVASQADADKLTKKDAAKNLAIVGDANRLSAITTDRVALGATDAISLSGVNATAISVLQTPSVSLERSEVQRAVIDRASTDETYLHVDESSKLAEIAIVSGGDITIEGNGALGLIRIQGAIGELTVRATASVINETDKEAAVVDPDGVVVLLQPGEIVSFRLEHYIVRFATEGTAVETQRVAPGASVDFSKAVTEKAGYVFTAWYEDAEYTKPFSRLDAIEGETTLYARFVNLADALTVSFETFGGRPLEPLYFAPGESLLTKPIEGIYTAKEGFGFGGWCADEECTAGFNYAEPVTESMTLYALFLSDEPVKEEAKNSATQLSDLDWQAEIPIIAPEGAQLSDLPELFKLTEVGVGGLEPELSFKQTEAGFSIYGAYFERDGQFGFEPGATFSIEAEDNASFAGFEESVKTLTVSIYREDVELIEFRDDLTYILWDELISYTAVLEVEDDEQADTPGELVLTEDFGIQPGDTFVLYDGNLFDGDTSVSSWEEGSFDGYMLFARAIECASAENGASVSFDYADPADYISAMEIHTKREYDLEEQLTDEVIARMTDDMTRQIMLSDEFKAQMLIAVMTSPDTQKRLDDMYGEGVYSLAGSDIANVEFSINKPDISFSKNGNQIMVQLIVSCSAKLVDDMGFTVLDVSPKLTIREEFTTDINIDGGFLWVDVSIEYHSVHTIRLEIVATSGHGTSTAVLDNAIDTLNQIITPDGITGAQSYQASVDRLMSTIQAISGTSLSYIDLFTYPISGGTAKLIIGGVEIGEFTCALEIPFQFGILATAGCQIVVTEGRRMGFKYNFLKFSGSSYNQKLESNTRLDVFVIGKVGVRIGIRQTFALSLLKVVKVSIAGGVYVYAELTGIYFYTLDLDTGASTQVGGVYFEVGIEAEITLDLKFKVLFIKYSKGWTLWSQRWPLYKLSWSTSLTYPALEMMDAMWEQATTNANYRSSYGFASVPMHTYSLFNGTHTQNELLWDAQEGKKPALTLAIQNMVLTERIEDPDNPENEEFRTIEIGDAALSADPRARVLYVGDGSAGKSKGKVFVNEDLAAEYLIDSVECDVVFTFADDRTSALVKKMEKPFHLTRKFELSITKVNAQFVLLDWCARAWGIEASDWNNTLIHEATFETKNILGKAKASTATGKVDLDAIINEARGRFSDLNGLSLGWLPRTVTETQSPLQYSNPKTSNYCFLTPANGGITYDVRPNSDEYNLTFYLYAYRFPGFGGDITYLVKLREPDAARYDFNVTPRAGEKAMNFAADAPYTWRLDAKRATFDGSNRALMMALDGGEYVDSGLTINGREPTAVVELFVERVNHRLDVALGEGVESYAFIRPEIASGAMLPAGTTVTLSVKTLDGYGNAGLVSVPAGLAFTRSDDRITFTMPAHDVAVTVVAYPLYQIDFLYNHADLGVYRSVLVAGNDVITRPANPYIAGMTFRDWYGNAECSGESFAFGSNPTGDTAVYADWNCNVTMDFNGGIGQAAYQDENGDLVFIFDGDESDYGRLTYSTLRVGQKPYDLATPTYAGYAFMGWYQTADMSANPVDLADYVLTGGATFYAGWAKQLAITYDHNHDGLGTYYTAIELSGQMFADVPVDPEREHYTFNGWYTDRRCVASSLFNPATDTRTQDTVLYAGWIPVTYAITYDLAGGAASGNPASYTIESGNITLNKPTRPGYTFAGWTGTDLTGTAMSVVIPAGSTGNRVYAAAWTPIVYNITYMPGITGATMPANPATYTIESDDILLLQPSKDGYDFEGWIGADLTAATISVTIAKGSMGNRVYTATWSSSNPDNQIILDARNALPDLFEYDLDEYDEATLYADARAAIDADQKIAPYAGGIVLTLNQKGNATEDKEKYTYVFTATIVYTNQASQEFTETKDVTVYVWKLLPIITELPKAARIEYGQSLSYSGLKDGVAMYGNSTVEGAFAWSSLTQIPKAARNGTQYYTAVFTPKDGATYRPATCRLIVDTQIGVEVRIEASPSTTREYNETPIATDCAYKLYDKDTGAELTGLDLLDTAAATYLFDAADAGDQRDIKFSGYLLKTADYTDPVDNWCLYSLRNSSAMAYGAADIKKASLAVTTMPTVTGTIEYTDSLAIRLNDGAVEPKNYVSAMPIAGTWEWVGSSSVDFVGANATLKARFVPSLANYASVEALVNFTALKKTVQKPTLSITTVTYNGSNQMSNTLTPLEGPGGYHFRDDSYLETTRITSSSPNANSYAAYVVLNTPNYYRWAGEADGKESYTAVVLTITKATATVSGTPGTISIGYGQVLGASKITNGKAPDDSDYVKQIGINDPGVITGLTVTPSGGTWVLNSSSEAQPMTFGTRSITATYTPADATNYIASSAVTIPVNVAKVTPDATDCDVVSHTRYQSPALENALSKWLFDSHPSPLNPITGERIPGSWSWVDLTFAPVPHAGLDNRELQYQYDAQFTAKGNSTCYNSVSKKVWMAVRNYMSIKVTTSVPNAINYRSTGGWDDYFYEYLTKSSLTTDGITIYVKAPYRINKWSTIYTETGNSVDTYAFSIGDEAGDGYRKYVIKFTGGIIPTDDFTMALDLYEYPAPLTAPMMLELDDDALVWTPGNGSEDSTLPPDDDAE